MEEVDYIGPTIAALPVLLAFANWAISLFVARGKENYTLVDLRQLWTDSLPFLRTQWHVIGITLAIATWFELQPVPELIDNPAFGSETFLFVFAPVGLFWVIGLFYSTYLAAPKYPGKLATIGFCSLAMYVIGDIVVMTLGTLGTFFFVAPGLIIFVRSCLFLPVYATHRSNPLTSIKQSWAITKNKYWLVSRYMGLPVLLERACYLCPELATNFGKSDVQHASLSWQAFSIASTAIALTSSLIVCGLLYKLYDRLSTEEQAKLLSHEI